MTVIHRCLVCNKPYKTLRGVYRHERQAHPRPPIPRNKGKIALALIEGVDWPSDYTTTPKAVQDWLRERIKP